MDIVHITSEFTGLAKVGGLADMVRGLVLSQKEVCHNLSVVLPFYTFLSLPNLVQVAPSVWKGSYLEVTIYLVKTPSSIEQVYGGHTLSNFLHFCDITHAFLQQISPSIIHLHDWPTALITLYPKHAPVIFTIHNAAYQGECPVRLLKRRPIPPPLYQRTKTPNNKMVNLLASAIEHADYVTTVSPSYLCELQDSNKKPSLLTKIIRQNSHKFLGILNGIDTHYWNPYTDPHLITSTNQTPRSQLQDLLKIKKRHKEQLFSQLQLHDTSRFLLVCITRLTKQKSPETIELGLQHIDQCNATACLLGLPTETKYQERFTNLSKRWSNSKNIRIKLKQEEQLAHQLFAAGDVLFVPSKEEPCGLTQMIAMRYGTIPIVRSVGGLRDSVVDNKNGFSFHKEQESLSTIDKALNIFYKTPDDWYSLQKNAQAADFSWKEQCKKYIQIYQQLSQAYSEQSSLYESLFERSPNSSRADFFKMGQ